MANILKYEDINIIIFYCYIYSGLSDTVEVVIWNSMRLMRNAEFSPKIDGWLKNRVWSTLKESRKSADVR